MGKYILFLLFFVLMNSILVAETLDITKVPISLPQNLSLESYSPLLEFDYSGLQQANYTLRVWLLNRGPWDCASSIICEKTIPINNSDGGNSIGILRIAQEMDVYNYSNMDFIARLYSSSGSQVAWDEQYVNGVANRPPVLNYIPNKNCVTGRILTFQATSTDPEGNALSYWASGLPDGAVLEPDGMFHWTPETEGTYKIYISVDDGITYDSQEVTISVGPEPVFVEINVPSCGTTQNVTGQVEGLGEIDDYKVISYVFVSGSGWWTKPHADQPKTDISPDGTFEIDITTGGIDELATIVYLGICQANATIPVLSGAALIPDDLPVLTGQKHYRNPADCHRIIEFSGYRWYVKTSGSGTLGPGSCYFSDSEQNISVDDNGYLHLQISNNGSHWDCSEIICLDEMGYGTYAYELASDPSVLDKNVVLGLYTWADDAVNGQEIDIEFSRWGDSHNENGQFVVQPWDSDGHLHRFEFPAANEPSIHRFRWQNEIVSFQSYVNTQEWPAQSSIVSDWTYSGETPAPGQVHPRINLWLFNNQPPSDGQPQELIIKSFEFSCLDQIQGDVNNDCRVDMFDLSLLASNWLIGLR